MMMLQKCRDVLLKRLYTFESLYYIKFRLFIQTIIINSLILLKFCYLNQGSE
jgi:hypothetical protein